MTKYNSDLATVIFNEQGFAINTGWAEIYLIDMQTREYNGSADEFIPAGVGLPAGAYLDAPENSDDPTLIALRSSDNSCWEQVKNHRGLTAYDKTTRAAITINTISLPEGYTLTAPASNFDNWNGKKWVLDQATQQATIITEAINKKAALLTETTQQIAVLQDAVAADIATAEEVAKLAVLKKYRVLLNRVDTSSAPEISWPEQP